MMSLVVDEADRESRSRAFHVPRSHRSEDDTVRSRAGTDPSDAAENLGPQGV